jgi:hypothetical protein
VSCLVHSVLEPFRVKDLCDTGTKMKFKMASLKKVECMRTPVDFSSVGDEH